MIFWQLKKKIIDKIPLEQTYPSAKIITDKSADYYWENTITFLIGILKNRKNESEMVQSMFKRAFKMIEI